MAPIPTAKRAHRVLDFLIAVESPQIMAALAPNGMTPAMIDEGWSRLREYARVRHPYQAKTDDLHWTEGLAAWQSRWWPVADAALERRYPKVHEQLFRNLVRTQGIELVLSIGELVDRLRRLERSPKQASRDAVGLLRERGLTGAVIADAETLLQQAARIREPESPATSPEEQRATEDALWDWYIEWSKISRATIRDPRMLKVLGFGRAGRPATPASNGPSPPAGKTRKPRNSRKGPARRAGSSGKRATSDSKRTQGRKLG